MEKEERSRPTRGVQAVQGRDTIMKWYYQTSSSKVVGPLDDVDLQNHVIAGKISRSTNIRSERMKEFVPYAQYLAGNAGEGVGETAEAHEDEPASGPRAGSEQASPATRSQVLETGRAWEQVGRGGGFNFSGLKKALASAVVASFQDEQETSHRRVEADRDGTNDGVLIKTTLRKVDTNRMAPREREKFIHGCRNSVRAQLHSHLKTTPDRTVRKALKHGIYLHYQVMDAQGVMLLEVKFFEEGGKLKYEYV
jgi:hypothetical protein